MGDRTQQYVAQSENCECEKKGTVYQSCIGSEQPFSKNGAYTNKSKHLPTDNVILCDGQEKKQFTDCIPFQSNR